MIESSALQSFLAVYESQGFTKAAQRLGRTQSAVSQQIAKLEENLGVTLFIRGREFGLTEDGRIFLPYAQHIVSLYHEAMDRFQVPELAGEVRFGLPEDFATLYLADVLADFMRLHPRIMLNVECDLTNNLYTRFKQNAYDMALLKMARPEDLPNGVEVWSEPLVWVGEASLIEPNKPVPLVLSPEPCVYRAQAIQALRRNQMAWRHVFSSPSFASSTAAVKAMMGISVLPRNMVPAGISIIRDGIMPALDNIHVSLVKQTSDNPAVNSFEEFVIKRLRA